MYSGTQRIKIHHSDGAAKWKNLWLKSVPTLGLVDKMIQSECRKGSPEDFLIR